ncbi:MAG: 50S ribosomal protein L18 [Candidatus Peregrinibacteria bacterium]
MALRKELLRQRRKHRIRARISGTLARPRLTVFRSLKGISAQLIDDEKGVTIASASLKKGNVAGAQELAKILGEKYTGPCVFDRNGYLYHGRVKAFAETAREAGLIF